MIRRALGGYATNAGGQSRLLRYLGNAQFSLLLFLPQLPQWKKPTISRILVIPTCILYATIVLQHPMRQSEWGMAFYCKLNTQWLTIVSPFSCEAYYARSQRVGDRVVLWIWSPSVGGIVFFFISLSTYCIVSTMYLHTPGQYLWMALYRTWTRWYWIWRWQVGWPYNTDGHGRWYWYTMVDIMDESCFLLNIPSSRQSWSFWQ